MKQQRPWCKLEIMNKKYTVVVHSLHMYYAYKLINSMKLRFCG